MELNQISNLPLADDYQVLTMIGLSSLSANSYQIVYQQDFISVLQIAQLLNRPYRSIHKVVKDLQAKGFIEHVYTGRHPYRYTAVLLQDAMNNYAKWQSQQVERLLKAQQHRFHEQALRKLEA